MEKTTCFPNATLLTWENSGCLERVESREAISELERQPVFSRAIVQVEKQWWAVQHDGRKCPFFSIPPHADVWENKRFSPIVLALNSNLHRQALIATVAILYMAPLYKKRCTANFCFPYGVSVRSYPLVGSSEVVPFLCTAKNTLFIFQFCVVYLQQFSSFYFSLFI